MFKWPWVLGIMIGVPLLLYIFGYFWTRGSITAKKEYLDEAFTTNPESDEPSDN